MAAHCMPSGGGSRLISRPTLESQTPKLAAGVPLMRHFRPGPLFIASEEILNKKKKTSTRLQQLVADPCAIA